MTKLYRVRVEVEFEMLIEADVATEAMQIARARWKNELDNITEPDSVGIAGEITSYPEIPEDWRGTVVYSSQSKSRVVEDVVAEIERQKQS